MHIYTHTHTNMVISLKLECLSALHSIIGKFLMLCILFVNCLLSVAH